MDKHTLIERIRPMFKRIAVNAFIVMLAAVPAFAQKAEVGVTFGWVFSDGVSGQEFVAPTGKIYSRVDPKDSFGWGIDLGFIVGPNAEVGFLYGNQPSKLTVGGTNQRTLATWPSTATTVIHVQLR